MTRKIKRAGGCLPLTYSERNRYRVASNSNGGSSAAAATSRRSLLPLGFCALTLSKIEDPPLDAVVVTPSGHVYSKAALLEYFLYQTKEYQQRQQDYEMSLQRKEQSQQQQQATKQQDAIQQFEQLQQQRGRNSASTTTTTTSNKRSISSSATTNFNDETDEATRKKKIKKELQNSSFWLAVAQPSLQDNHDDDDDDEDKTKDQNPSVKPPQRPVSPCSGQVLRRKQWREVVLERQAESGHVLCGFSGKTITTQSSVAIFPPKMNTGYVVLQQAYNEYIRPTMICPKTSVALKESRHVVILQQHGRSNHHDNDDDAGGDAIGGKNQAT